VSIVGFGDPFVRRDGASSFAEVTCVRESVTVRLSVLEEQVKADRRALELQAKEISRRLDELNHAHEKQVKDQQTYVSADKFDGYVANQDSWRSKVDTTLALLEGKSGGVGLARAALNQNIMLVIMGIGVLVALGVALYK